jgi:hypothetical protein
MAAAREDTDRLHPAPKEGGLSAQATYADCILAAKGHLDEATHNLGQVTEDFPAEIGLGDVLDICNVQARLGAGYARLALALQKPPGQRF